MEAPTETMDLSARNWKSQLREACALTSYKFTQGQQNELDST